jgi:hypothetical protein
MLWWRTLWRMKIWSAQALLAPFTLKAAAELPHSKEFAIYGTDSQD